MRKQFLTTATVLAAMALGASTASATPPDFPHSDFDGENWASVIAYDQPTGQSCSDLVSCEFDDPFIDQWYWQSNSPNYWAGWSCSGSISGSIGGDGSVAITDGTLGGWSSMCGVSGFPWAGQMCAHVPTGEIWLRQNITLDPTHNPPSSGITFGQYVEDEYENRETLVFDLTDSGIAYYGGYHWLHDVDIEIGDGLFAVDASEPSGCGWPELS